MSERVIVVILPSEQYVGYILARMGYTFLRWWWCLLYIRPTRWGRFLLC